MGFKDLLKKISPKLKMIARFHRHYVSCIDEDDLYQEMRIYLWNNFKEGVPEGLNEAYIIKGCKFYLLNYLRKERLPVKILSLEEPINEEGNTLEDVLPDTKESLDRRIERDLAIEEIKNNGFTPREKQVFSLSLKGYTVREAGKKLGISHVMVVKYKQRIINKWHKKEFKVTKGGRFLLL